MTDQNHPSKPRFSLCLLAGATFAFLAVVLGAFGAHALNERLNARGMLMVWETAVDYQFWHALGLFGLGLRPAALVSRLLNAAAIAWGVGIIFFSGSLYWLALGGPKWLGPVTPLGGLSFMVGWLLIVIFSLKAALKG